MKFEQIEASFVIVGRELLTTPDMKSAFPTVMGLEAIHDSPLGIHVDGVAQGVVASHRMTFPRQRISLQLSPERSSVTKEFPDGDADLMQLADVIASALSESALPEDELWSFGFNSHVVYDQGIRPTAREYLVDRLVNQERFAAGGAEITAGLAFNLVGRSDECSQWNLRLEPRFQDPTTSKVFMWLNHHFEQVELPDSRNNTFQYLSGVVSHAHRLIEAMNDVG